MMHKLVKSQSCISEANVTFYVNHSQIVKKKKNVGEGDKKKASLFLSYQLNKTVEPKQEMKPGSQSTCKALVREQRGP